MGNEILYCRTCMKIISNPVNLFEPLEINLVFTIFADILKEMTNIEVSEHDNLPKYICSDCKKQLQMFNGFKTQALEAEIYFKQMIEITSNLEVKEEIFTDFPFQESSACDDNFDINEIYTPKKELEITDFKIVCIKPCADEIELRNQTFQDFECDFCSQIFKNKHGLKNHIISEHQVKKENRSQQLSGSSDVLIDNTNLEKDQIKTSSNKNQYPCSKCDLVFTKKRSLGMHKKRHKQSFSHYQCDTCGKEFSTKSILKRHLRIHSGIKPFACTTCNKKYSRHDQLEIHTKKHTGIKSHQCPYCPKSFEQVCSFKDHIRTHTGETPYLCSTCGKGFANRSNLRQHVLRHTGAKPYVCQLCPKSFASKGQMQSHMETHSGLKPFKCDMCSATFTKKHSLSKHKERHLGNKPYKCDTCNMQFLTNDHLKRHYRTHTGEKPYHCSVCKKSFSQSNDLNKHMRTHFGANIYQCSMCSLRFRLNSELRHHYATHYQSKKDDNEESFVKQENKLDPVIQRSKIDTNGNPSNGKVNRKIKKIEPNLHTTNIKIEINKSSDVDNGPNCQKNEGNDKMIHLETKPNTELNEDLQYSIRDNDTDSASNKSSLLTSFLLNKPVLRIEQDGKFTITLGNFKDDSS